MQANKYNAISEAYVTARLLAVVLLFVGLTPTHAQSPEWSERDLAKSVHRAEQTFLAGEMSRAYGLFAHLVSVANDRAFLHYRFGATCTFTSQRLNEAQEHLEIARELGIFETEHEAGWHYYKGRLHHVRYEFSEAAIHFRTAIDLASKKDNWINDAKLRFGQCNNQGGFSNDAFAMIEKETLISHSEDFFRLYEFPISMGRLLVVPQQLLSKEDKKRGYESQLHWLPGHRYAYYASYGKEGDTGLDIYRVAVNSSGEYSAPMKMPEPINGDFDDCSPICIPGESNELDQIFFSSSRPESIGGYDIFKSLGDFTSEELIIMDQEIAMQLPFEVNSTADEFLYWDTKDADQAWLTTNRNQDFEGREVWRFNRSLEHAHPVALTFMLDSDAQAGTLKISEENGPVPVLQSKILPGESFSTVLKQNSKLTISWENENGNTYSTEIVDIPTRNESAIASDPIIVSSSSKGTISDQLAELQFISQPDLTWTFSAMNAKDRSGEFGESLSQNEFASLYGGRLGEISIEKVLQAANQSTEEETVEQHTVPAWIHNAMVEAQIIPDHSHTPRTITQARREALTIQGQMEKTQCWDSPGSKMWKVAAAIERYGEPALAVLSDQTRSLRNRTAELRDDWVSWTNKLENHVQSLGTASEDWIIMLAYFEAQVKSYNGAVIHAEDMFRRIDSHLQFERWLTETMPMAIPEFRTDLIRIIQDSPEVYQAIHEAAIAVHQNSDPVLHLQSVQNGLWNALTDSITEFQTLDIYSLPGMEDSQAWFLRSGGIMDEIETIADLQERKSKGQQAIGLAWETYRVGADQYNRVINESQMSPGAWWQSFGPKEAKPGASGQPREYSGYEMFVKHDDPILEQAHLYQKELDDIRTGTRNEESYRATVKRAIAMRSTIANEMVALFGGEHSPSDNPTNLRNTIAAEFTSSPTQEFISKDADKVIEDIIPALSNEEGTVNTGNLAKAPTSEPTSEPSAEPSAEPTLTTRTDNMFTVQVGAFLYDPNFKAEQNASDAFIIEVAGKFTKYGVGNYPSIQDAEQRLDEVLRWAPDAFIKRIPSDGVKKRAPIALIEETTKKKTVEAKKTKKSKVNLPSKTPKKKEEVSIARNFRVRIVEYSGTLKPAQVASLLRLGNAIDLKTAKLTTKTVYFTENFTSVEDAQVAFELILSQGFKEAEIEVIY